MVQNPGKTPRSDQLRPLNQPRPIAVVTEGGVPVALGDEQGNRLLIAQIQEQWRIDDEWWRETICRHYYRVILATGAMHTIYYDAAWDSWHEQSY